MNIEIHYDPIAHVIIGDFFTKDEYDTLYSLIQKIEPEMHSGKIMNEGSLVNVVNKTLKNNLNFWPYHRRDLIESDIISSIIEEKMWTFDMQILYQGVKDSAFNYYKNSNKSQILISKYTKNDFYKEHFDTMASITGNIWISNDDVMGGNFILKNVLGETKQIDYKNNTCLLFPSQCLHTVTPIENDCKRFSIQYFAQTDFTTL